MAGTFFHGDNLEVMRAWFPDECVDLVYLDPPFNSDQDFNLPFGADKARPAQKKKGFTDTWWWDPAAIDAYDQVTKTRAHEMPEKLPGVMRSLHEFLYPKYRHVMLAYLANMAVRLVELRRVMKPAASLYLHCDPTASHYLKMILDAVFGLENFRNEAIWKRTTSHSSAKKYAPVHDTILYYSKSDSVTWNAPRTDYDQAYLDKYYRFDDGDGRLYWRADITGAGVRNGETGEVWRGFDVTAKGRHWAYPPSVLDTMDREGRVYWAKGGAGWPQEKRYRTELKGRAVSDIWDDVSRINPVGSERVGYPTQKPLALLKRIIEASSKPGDLVLDPFCGCGTTVIACEQLGRRWLGVDIGDAAIKTLRDKRLPKEAPDAKITEKVEPFDPESLRLLAGLDEGYEFQWWADRKLGGRPVNGVMKKGADRGQDGEIFIESSDEYKQQRRLVISAKSGGKPTTRWVSELAAVINNPANKAYMGVLVTLEEPKRNLRDRAREELTVPGSPGGKDIDKIQIVWAKDLLTLGEQAISLPGRNVTPPWKPTLPIPDRVDQVPLAVDQKPQRDRRRAAALVADNTRRMRKPRTGPLKVEPKQVAIPGAGDSFRLTSGRKK